MKLVIVIVTIIGLAAVIGAIVVGTRSFDGTVVDKPYDRGLVWDAEQRQRRESGLSIEMNNRPVRVGRNDISFRVSQKEGQTLSGTTVNVMVSRPSTRAYDRTYTAAGLKGGLYMASIDLPLYGYWDAKIAVSANEKIVTFEQKLFAER